MDSRLRGNDGVSSGVTLYGAAALSQLGMDSRLRGNAGLGGQAESSVRYGGPASCAG